MRHGKQCHEKKKCHKVPKCLKAQKCPQIIHVGSNKKYKQISDAIKSLKNKFILRDVIIKVDSGTYDPFKVDEYVYINDDVGTVTIRGDTREIAAKTYLNLSCPGPFPDQTLTYSPDGDNTIIEINPAPDLAKMGLVVGDKAVLYNADFTNVFPTLRFIEKTVLNVEDNKFMVEGLINYTSEGSAVTFLPNVNVKSFSVDMGGYAISVSNPCKIIGITAEEPDDKTTPNIVGNIVINSGTELESCVAKSTTGILTYPLSESDIKFVNAHALLVNNSDKLLLNNFTTLGTGSDNQFLIPGTISITNSVAELRDVNSIGSVGAGASGGIEMSIDNSEILLSGSELNLIGDNATKKISAFQSNIKTIQMTINIFRGFYGIDISNGSTFNGNPQLCLQENAVVGVNLSKNSVFNYSNIASQSFIVPIFWGIKCDHSSADISGLTIEKYKAGVSAAELSGIVLKNFILKDPQVGATDYCIDESSTIVNDGMKLNPPACN